MSGYDRHGSSRDPPVDRGGYYRRDDSRVGAWDGAPRDHHDDGYFGHNHREHHRRDHDRGGYGGPSRRDSYPPRDGYGAGGPDRGDPGYGRYAPYDRAPNDRYRDPPERERYGGYDRRDAYDRPPISDPAPSQTAPRARGPVTGAYPLPPARADDEYGYQDERRAPAYDDRYDDRRDPYASARGGGGDYYSGGGGGGGEVEDVLEVPAEVAKIVIGQGGRSIKDLQERTGAHVLIHKPAPGEPVGNTRQVRVKGRVASVDAAVAELRRKVLDFEYARGGSGGGTGAYDPRGGASNADPYGAPSYGDPRDPRDPRAGFGPPRRAGDVEENVECPTEHRGMIIGKGGARVARLEQETGVKVRSDKETPYITLIGTPRAVAQARSQVLAILALADLPPMPEAPPPDAPPAAEVPVPGDAIGKVMGKAGLNIKATQCRTGCFMNWDKNARVMRLWGGEDVVAAGREAIERDIVDALAEREEKNASRANDAPSRTMANYPYEAGAREQVPRSHVPPSRDKPTRAPEPVISTEVPVRGHGGLVIGRGGENVKRMERDSGGARMKMHRDKQVVIVTGFADQVDRGVRLVEACVDRAVAAAKQKELSAMHAAGAQPPAQAAWTGPPEAGEIVSGDDAERGLGETEETFSRGNEPDSGEENARGPEPVAEAEAEASA
jgi:far upstream element-binding protein